MKISSRILPTAWVVATLLAVVGCSHPVLDYRNADVSDGLIYATGANEPFTGTVTHVPDSFMLNGEGFAKFMNEVGGAKYATARFVQAILGKDSSTFMCTISVRKGYVDGGASCYRPQSDTQIIEAHFTQGQLSGKFVYYNAEKPGEKLAEGDFAGGLPDGTQKIYSASTGEMTAKVHWSQGLYDGDYATYDETSGKVVLKGSFVQGKREGTWEAYAKSGKPLVARESYQNGVLQGVQEIFDADTGKRVQLVDQWIAGRISGTRQVWDKNGELVSDEVYADGTLVQRKEVRASATEVQKQGVTAVPPSSTPPEASSNPDVCVDGWVKAHRKEVGDDALITADQLSEWREWCGQGKHAPM